MEKIHSSENISNLCKAVTHMIELHCPQNEVEKYVRALQLACCGSLEDHFSRLYGSILSPSEMLDALFKVENFVQKLRSDSEWSLRIVCSLLNISRLSEGAGNVLQAVVPVLISKLSYTEMREIILKIANHPDFSLMPVGVVEIVLEKEPIYMESAVISILEEAHKTRNENKIWKNTKYWHWVSWGSQSSVLFLKLASLLNQFLLMLKCRATVMSLIKAYVENVSELCFKESRDFVNLYPIKYQSLVILLKTDLQTLRPKDTLLSKEYIVKKLRCLRKENPSIALLLLSHYPQWGPHLEKSYNNPNLEIKDHE